MSPRTIAHWASETRLIDDRGVVNIGRMPRISYFRGIAIYMYWDEGAHATPHFHALHAGRRASVDLEGRVLAGDIDSAALGHVQEWARMHREELLSN